MTLCRFNSTLKATCGALLGLWIALCLPGIAVAQGVNLGSSEVLPATEAYVPSVSVASDRRIVIDWHIEPGHYLYRDKTTLSLAANGTELILDAPDFPEALIEVDAFFGESAVYRGATLMTVMPMDAFAEPTPATLSITYQGCADIGLCYPPTTVTRDVLLEPSAASTVGTTTDAAPGFLRSNPTTGNSGGLFGESASDGLLRPEEAYIPMVLSASTTQLELLWTIEDGYYIYRDKLSYHLSPDAAPLPLLERTEGVVEHDEFFGDVAVNRGEARALVALDGSLASGDDGVLTVAYQGCAEIGVCFPPSVVEVPFVVDSVGQTPAVTAALIPTETAGINNAQTGNTGTVMVAEHDRLTGMLADSNLWLSVGTFFLLGVLLAFTPCVLPMIPILSTLIVGQRGEDGGAIGSGRAFRLSAVYVLVMASTYAIAGVLVALSGKNVQIWLQSPIVLSLFAALFVLFALAMFGLFQFQMPQAIQSRLTAASNAQKGGGYRGVVTMGFLSTLIVGPCVTAPLAGALLYIADTGDAWVGGAALFALGLGMGAPLLLIGTSAATLVPKAGAWMERIKQGFGILMLGMAIWMLSRFISAEATALLAGLLVLGTGVWLGAADKLDSGASGWARTAKGAGLAVALYGVAILLGTLAGGSSLTQPLAVYTGGPGNLVGTGSSVTAAEDAGLVFQRIKSIEDLDRVVAAASSEGRSVMLDFYADWCISCKEMEHFTFTDQRVKDSLEGVILVQADVTANDDIDKALLERFRLFAPPAIIFYGPAGNEIPEARVVGFVKAERFSAHVDAVLTTSLAAGS